MRKKIVELLVDSGRFPELIGATVAINLLGLSSSLYSIHLLNRYVSIGLTPTLVTLTLGAVLAIGFEVALRRQRQKVLDAIGRDHEDGLSQDLFRSFTTARYEALNGVPIATRREALGALSVLQQVGSTGNLAAILDLPFVGFYILGAGLLYWPLGLASFMGCALALLLGILSEREQREAAGAHAKASSRSQQMGQFLIAAGEAIRCLPLNKLLGGRWSEIQRDSLGARRDGMILQANMQSSIQTIGQLITVSIYSLGAVAAVNGVINTGVLIGANILAARAFSMCSRAAYLADPILRASRAKEAVDAVASVEAEPASGATPAVMRGRLELVDAIFAYPQQPVPIFERLDVFLNPGQVAAITGANGAGKSTLIRVMLGLLTPQRGLVRADGIELRQLSQDWWRGHVGYAPQEPVFFDGTLRENIVLDRNVPDDVILSMAHEMDLGGFLAADPKGLERMVSSHDAAMAVGIRRRFALIRAILGNPQIVFLDDPTEGLDSKGVASVASLLNRLLSQGKTLVVASNEQFISRAADVVIDMNKKPVPEVRSDLRQPAKDQVDA